MTTHQSYQIAVKCLLFKNSSNVGLTVHPRPQDVVPMSLSFNTSLLQKKRSHCIVLEYLLSTDMKIQMGSGMLLERMLLSSNGTGQNLEAKLSNRFFWAWPCSPKKETILAESWGSQDVNSVSSIAMPDLVWFLYKLTWSPSLPCCHLVCHWTTKTGCHWDATFTQTGWEKSPRPFLVVL